MSVKKKNFIKGTFEISLLISIVIILNHVMVLKSMDGYEQIKAYYRQEENTVDVIFLGSSKMYCQIDTGILWDNYGISSFDLGGAEAPAWNAYYLMREALKTQKPKVVLFDASIMGNMPDMEYHGDQWAMMNNYGMNWNTNRIEQLRINTPNYEKFRELVFPLATMHSRYSDISKDDFIDERNDISYKGFDFKEGVTALQKPKNTLVDGEFAIMGKQEEYLLKMAEYSRQNGVDFVVIIAPYAVTENELKYFNYIRRICEESEIKYVNLNNMYDEIGIDFSTDYAELLHLNIDGITKYTEYLGKYLTMQYELVDHRGDNIYASWERDALRNRQNRALYELNKVASKEELFSRVLGENYIVFYVDHQSNLYIYDNGNRISESDGDITVRFTDGNDRIIVKKNGEKTKININRAEYKVGWPWNRIIVYDKVLKKIVVEKEFEE